MSLSSVSSASYSSVFIQSSSTYFSSSIERQDTQRTDKSADHRSERRDEDHRREAKSEDSRPSHESDRRNPFSEISDLRGAFEAFRKEGHGENRSGDHNDDDDRQSYRALESYSATSISININISSILQLQEIEEAPGPAAIAAPAPAPVPAPAPAPALTAPAPAPVEVVTTAAETVPLRDPAALPSGIEDTLQALTNFLENLSTNYSVSGDSSVYQSLSFEAQYTSFSLEFDGDQSYQVDLTSISIAFSQSSYGFTDGAASFTDTEFSLDIQAYSASFSAEAYSNSLVSNLLSNQGALFA